jgi:hypothetical protein
MFLQWAFRWWKRENLLSLAIPDKPTATKPVVLEDLHKLLEEADRIVVKHSPEAGAEALFDSTDKKDLEELWKSLTLEAPETGEWSHCMCHGTPALYVYQHGRELLQLTNHHGLAIRCSLWDSDVRVIDNEKWLSWFDDRGISAPRQEIKAMRGHHAQSKKDWERWLTAMPKAVQLVWSGAIAQFGEVDLVPLRAALEQEMPDRGERILALLEWFGSGAGPWSGFPSYESAAENLLLDFPTAEIIKAAQSASLSSAQTEGAARLLAGWAFGRKRAKDLKELPEALKKALWHHTEFSKDKDKIERAKRVFTK